VTSSRPETAAPGFPPALSKLSLSLIALLAASVAIPLLIFAAVAWEGYRAAFDAAGNRGHQIASLLEEHAHSTLKAIELALRHTDERLKGIDWETIRKSREIWQELKTFQEMAPQVGSIFVVSPDGRNPLTTRVFPAPDIDFSERDYFVEQKKADQGVYVSGSYVGKISSEPIFNLSIRRRSSDGRFNGVIGSSVFVDYFEAFYSTGGAPGDEFTVALVRADGKALVGFPQVPAPRDIDPQIFASAGSRMDGAFTMRSPATGVDRLYSFRRVKDYPVYVLYGIDRSTVIAAWLRDLALWGVITLASIATLLFAWWLVMRRTADVERQVVDRTAALARTVEEKDILLREVHHRVKNNLQTMASMVRIVSRSGTRESQPAFQDIARRIVTVGKAYDHIHKADRLAALDLSAYLRGICEQIFGSAAQGDVRLRMQFDPLMVDIDTAMPIGLIASELITNACKYATPGAGAGIAVRFKVRDDHATLTVRDDGPLRTPEALAESSGLKIAESLAGQIGGRIRGKNRPEGGVQFRLTFPIDRAAWAPLQRAVG
jgi:two-component system NtrC family sensor kinase